MTAVGPGPGGALGFAQAFGALALGEIVAKAAGLAAFAWLARALGPERYGAVELAAALAFVFGLLVDFGLGPVAAREVARDRSTARALARAVPGARLALALVACVGMLATAYGLTEDAAARRLLGLFSLSLLVAPLTLNWLLQGLERVPLVAPAQPLRMAVFALGVFVWVRGPADLLRVGVLEIVAASAAGLWFVAAAVRLGVRPGLAFAPARLGRLLAEAAPVGSSQLLWALNQQLPTLLVARLLGGAELAFFGAAQRIALGLASFAWLWFFTLYPGIVRASDRGGEALVERLRPSFRWTAWLGVGIALSGGFAAAPLTRLAFGEPFAASGPALALLLWTLPVHLLSGHARFALIGAGHARRELAAQAVGVAVLLVVGLVLVPEHGGRGAACAALAAALSIWIAAQALARGPLGALPFAAPLVRPALAAGLAGAAAALAPAPGPLLRGAVALGLYAAFAALLEPALRRDVRALRRVAAPR